MRSPRTLRRTVILTLAATLLAASCGGGDDDEPTAATDPEEVELPECPLDALEAATGPVEVVVWHTQTARPLETLIELVDEYNASQRTVRVSATPAALIAGHSAPSIV